MNLFPIIVLCVGVLMACSNFPQAYKIFKRKSAKDIAPITPILITFGSIVWFFYGLYIDDIPLIVANGIGIISASLVVLGYFFYK